MSEPDWRPGISLEALRARAELLAAVRAFFADRDVLEVDTPVLGSRTVSDPHLHSISARDGWLQTSPEYFMKRLLAAGSGPIFQIAHAFRADEQGRQHNREFRLLEWYRPGFDDAALMDEMDALFEMLLGSLPDGFPARRVRFRELVRGFLGIDPLTCPTGLIAEALDAVMEGQRAAGTAMQLASFRREGLLELAYAEASRREAGAMFVTEFPVELAALARLRSAEDGALVSSRFELVVNGVELANGFHELCDPVEQRRRFEADLELRAQWGLPDVAIDEAFLAALEAGLPDCAGVAVGLDRVLMLQRGAASLDEVMPFAAPRS